MLLAQMSDFHVVAPGALAYGRIDTAACLARAIAALNALDPQPDLVVGTGDLVQSGADAEYANLRVLLEALRAPFLPLPGNHDERAAFRRAFPEFPFAAAHLQLERRVGPMRILTLDTVRPGSDDGELDGPRLNWLAERLRDPCPTLLAMHHPPCPVGVAWMEPAAPAWSEGLGALLEDTPGVKRILCGHIHRTLVTTWRGRVACASPSTAHQVALDLGPAAPPMFSLEAPGFLLHHWDGREVISYAASVSGFPERFAPGAAS